MLFTTTPGQHLRVVMNLKCILKNADIERDRPYNITVSGTNSMMASIFTLICISIIFYEIFNNTDGGLRQPDVPPT